MDIGKHSNKLSSSRSGPMSRSRSCVQSMIPELKIQCQIKQATTTTTPPTNSGLVQGPGEGPVHGPGQGLNYELKIQCLILKRKDLE